MARKLRVYYPGAIYHVIARGNNRQNIFLDSTDKNKYLELIARYKEKYNYLLFAYVLMDNHIHILVQVNEYSLAKIMQGLQLTYTQYFNRRYDHKGHVFEQRYKAFLCENDAYLLKLVCYIHQNPVRANLSYGINYNWSSHKYYNLGKNGLVNISFVLDMLHSKRAQAIKMYQELVGAPVRNEEFISKDDKALNNKAAPAVTAAAVKTTLPTKNKYAVVTLEELAAKIAHEYCVDFDDMLGHCRVRKVVHARNHFIFEAINLKLSSRMELAKRLKVDPARITRVYQEMCQEMLAENKSNNK